MRTLSIILLTLAVATTLACRSGQQKANTSMTMDQVAEAYVELALALGQHDPAYIDAFYGPAEWKTRAEQKKESLDDIKKEGDALIEELLNMSHADMKEEIEHERHAYLTTQLSSLLARVDMLQGKKFTFDQEAKALYDVTPPVKTEAEFQKVLDELNTLLPGSAPLVQRVEEFKKSYVIPKNKVDAVFQAAIAACRERTLQHTALPKEESFKLEYVTGKSWSGYNWYQGNSHSLIQINTDLPIYIDRAIDLACHEGYPGHHVYNMLLEKNLVKDRKWVEYTVYPLFSPQSLIAEGSANYGIDIAFPGEERVKFEREKLFPLAGLNPATAEKYYQVFERLDKLKYAGNEAARQYLDGKINAQQAAEYLQKYALMDAKRAEQRVRFMDDYRSYVINYNLGEDMVKQYVETRAGADPKKRWEVFLELISSPKLPSSLY